MNDRVLLGGWCLLQVHEIALDEDEVEAADQQQEHVEELGLGGGGEAGQHQPRHHQHLAVHQAGHGTAGIPTTTHSRVNYVRGVYGIENIKYLRSASYSLYITFMQETWQPYIFVSCHFLHGPYRFCNSGNICWKSCIYHYLCRLAWCRVWPVWRVILSSSVVLAVSASSSCSSPATTTTASLGAGAAR